MSKKQICNFIIIVILFSITLSFAYGYDNGFGQARKIEGKHFVIYYAPQIDISALTQQLNIGPADKVLIGKSTEKKPSLEAELIDMLDTLFMQVGNILDMNLYSFRGIIKICRDYNQLNSIYNNLFDTNLKGRHSFYIYSLNTIYISSEHFTAEVLGHEIAHAIISHYFVVQPSVKIQEVLAGYVEYQLRKTGQK